MTQEELLATIRKELDSLKNDIKELYDWKSSSNERQIKIEIALQYIKQSIDELKTAVTKLNTEPKLKWDKLTTSIVSAVVVLIAGYLFSQFLK